jgi:signal transduction histidine kinase
VPREPAATTDNSAAGDPRAILAARLQFLQITPEDCRRVRALAPVFRTHAAEFVERFYAHLLAFPATATLLRDPEVVVRLRRLQMDYFESLFHAEIGPDYVIGRQRIGQTHAAVGVEPQWFLGAFNQYIQQCLDARTGLDPGDVAAYAEAMRSLLKLIMLDIGLTLDAYWAQATANLQQALGLYTQANAELREFAHLVSHDLKTPLATVSGLCEEFLDEFGPTVPGAARELIEAARSRALRMKGMIDELLAVSEAAARPTHRSRVSARAVLDEALGRARQECGEKAVTFEVPDSLPAVHAHAGRLAEAFYHLLSNAVKFLDKEPGVVRVTVTPGRAEHVFCVADNGPGIDPSELPRIFAPFHRLARHRHLPGSGLGLYFVKRITEEQGGRVWAESEPGRGSRFYMVVPAARED